MHITIESREEHEYSIKLADHHNEAKYEALLARLAVAETLRVAKIEVKTDSQVLVNQVLGEFVTKG